MRNMIPLPGTFMITAMLGFLITTVYTVSGRIDPSWGFAFNLIFLVMFISSVLSITPDPLPKAPSSAKSAAARIYGKAPIRAKTTARAKPARRKKAKRKR